MIHINDLVAGARIKHNPTDREYKIVDTAVKMRNPNTHIWYDAVAYAQDSPDEGIMYVRAREDFESFDLVSPSSTV